MAPLDWGLGHTTRCIPLLRHLRLLGADVLFAGTVSQHRFVQSQLPDVECLPLQGYNVTYARTGHGFLPKLLSQLPRLQRTIRAEHRWLEALAAQRPIDGVLSDNRYGLWHPKIPSVILTHQLRVRTGLGNLADGIFQKLHYRLLDRFGACWVVDIPESPGLSGLLAHPALMPQNARYIGPLSQFEGATGPVAKKHLLILLSGPEPQRTLLSDLLWPQALELGLPVVFVEGKRDAPQRDSTATVQWRAQTGGDELRDLLQAASYTVCRSGYSTLMDAAILNARLIVVPTPGQTEQAYLGQQLQANNRVLCHRQDRFSLQEALAAAQRQPYEPWPANGSDRYKPVLRDWLDSLPGGRDTA